MDEISSQFGACPNLWRLFFFRPSLWWVVFTGPAAPYQYRLQGPHSWPGAENALRTVWDRFRTPLATRDAAVKRALATKTSGGHSGKTLLIVSLLTVAFSFFLLKLL